MILVLLALGACNPSDRTPGTWLSGERVDTPVIDWRFSDEQTEVFLQTSPWYGIPHSITVVMAATADGVLYVPSIYSEPAEFPGTKYWNRIISANPELLLKVGDKLYPRIARLVESEAEFQRGFETLAAKYPFWRSALDDESKRPPFVIIRLDPPA
ncbi:MAG: hypothetical protein O3A63_12245 [Proteobacteria bacterium]|nr:hypothetical protein [Pseudomonadota bacterium]